MNDDTNHRRYVCTSCGHEVRARAFEMGGDGTYPNGLCVGCECTWLDSLPYELDQEYTPDCWRIEREDCCAEQEAKELEVYYGEGVADYRCPDCGATYRWDGRMAGFPDREATPDERPEKPLTDL